MEVPIMVLEDLSYINTPNEQSSISDEDIRITKESLFIGMDDTNQALTFGQRAVPLLRPPLNVGSVASDSLPTTSTAHPTNASSLTEAHSLRDIPQPRHPSFISFLGDSGTGKSWILRSLFRTFPDYPVPLSSPGKIDITISTSSDICLYADGVTASDPNPILFLDFEGLSGTD